MAETSGPRRPTGRKRYLTLLLPPLLVAVALVGVLVLFDRPDSRPELDEDLCAIESDESVGRAVLLLDFRKPLNEENLSLPGELLVDVSHQIGANTELRVFALSPESRAPRLSLDRLCKPYDDADLQIDSAKDQTHTNRDCDDLPAQLPAPVRESAERFCARRNALRARVDALARHQPLTPITNSYLMEAIEDTVIELSEGSGPQAIYVFSDMMQHAEWYSHLDLDWTDWSFADFAETRARQTTRLGVSPTMSSLTVRVFYLPRLDLTEHPRPKRAHQAFWQEYFADAKLTFEEQENLPAYVAEPLMNRLTPEELAALERAEIEKERADAARMLDEVRKEREALLEAQRRLAEESARVTAAPRARSESTGELRGQEQLLNAQHEQPDAREARLDQTAAEEPPDIETTEPTRVAEQETTETESQIEAPVNGNAPAVAVLTEPPASVSQDPPDVEPIEELAFADSEPGPADLPPCPATLLPRFADAAADIYPGRRRMNYGSATITVRYRLDEDGATVNDEIAVDRDQSSAERPRSFNLFATAAMQVVRNWVFEFENGEQGACSKFQERSTKFQFSYN
ncbi:MAG: hypothetical protein OXH52_06500 [Gammaproteobacteria bacterium]|nr:hypothetical protein [Gammaproteobacteria bacterium]